MARPRQPVDLLVFKGKKNLTKQEIEERKSQEVKAANDKVKAPTYLPKELKKDFKKISDQLIAIGIMTNLDVDALVKFVRGEQLYRKVTDTLERLEPTKTITDPDTEETYEVENEVFSKTLISQDKLFKQCRAAASDLGLTISSRCRLVLPKKEEKDVQTEEERMFGGKV